MIDGVECVKENDVCFAIHKIERKVQHPIFNRITLLYDTRKRTLSKKEIRDLKLYE